MCECDVDEEIKKSLVKVLQRDSCVALLSDVAARDSAV